MTARKQALAVLLATLCAGEAVAQVVKVPARVQLGGLSAAPISAIGGFIQPVAALAPAAMLSAPSLSLAAHAAAANPLPQAAGVQAAGPSAAPGPNADAGASAGLGRDAPIEDSSRAGAESFAAIYPEAGPLNILIMGPPGSGKTTFGKMLARDYGMVHVSVGELLRAKAAADPALTAQMAKGELVDSALVRGVVLERLSRPDIAASGFVLDGFPRRPEEIGVIESWIKDGGKLHALVNLKTPDAELSRRIAARGRMDDSPEVFARRMEIYREETAPVLEHFRTIVPVLEADASAPAAETNYPRVKALIERVRAALRR